LTASLRRLTTAVAILHRLQLVATLRDQQCVAGILFGIDMDLQLKTAPTNSRSIGPRMSSAVAAPSVTASIV
jgi:hypothetical protein